MTCSFLDATASSSYAKSAGLNTLYIQCILLIMCLEMKQGILIDAINVFIYLNQQLALENINRIGPSVCCVAQNSFTASFDLFLTGTRLQSREGSSQGYPFAMEMYGVAILPLIVLMCSSRVTENCTRTMAVR